MGILWESRDLRKYSTIFSSVQKKAPEKPNSGASSEQPYEKLSFFKFSAIDLAI